MAFGSKALACLFLFAFCAEKVAVCAPASTKDNIAKHDIHVSSIPEELVIDILNVTPEDFMKGVTKRNINPSTYNYIIDDQGQVKSAIWLLIGNQKLYIMPQAYNVIVQIINYTLTSEIKISYTIGESVVVKEYDEEYYSCLSQMVWSRMFRPRLLQSERSDNSHKQDTYMEAIRSRMTWTTPYTSLDEKSDECIPVMDVELTDTMHTNKVAESHEHKRIKDSYTICSEFMNAEDRWNGIYLHGLKVPVSRFCDRFTVCYLDIGPQNTKLIVAAHVDQIWIENTYEIINRGTNYNKLIPMKADYFDDLDELPSRVAAEETNGSTGEPITLDIDNFNAEDPYFELHVENDNKIYRYKDGTSSNSGGHYRLETIKFSDVEHTLKPEQKFVLLAFSRPFVATHFVTLITQEDFIFSVRKWYGASLSSMKPFPFSDPASVFDAVSSLKSLLKQNLESSGLSKIQLWNAVKDGDIICLGKSQNNTGDVHNMCKPLNRLSYTQVMVDNPVYTLLKVKAKAPPSFIVLGGGIIALGQNGECPETLIHFSHASNTPHSLIVSNRDIGVKSVVETGVGTMIFEELDDIMLKLPSDTKSVDIDISNFTSSEETGLVWRHRWLDNLWIIAPTKYPEFSLGSVTYNGCKLIPPKKRGYSFVVAPNNTDPDSVVVFYPTSENTRFAVKLKKAKLSGYFSCYLEPIKHKPINVTPGDLRKSQFESLFNRAKM